MSNNEPVAQPRGVVRGYFVPVLDTREEAPVTLGELAGAVLHRWWVVVAVTVAFVAGGAVLAFVPKKKYEATVVMSTVTEAPTGGAIGGLLGQFGGLASLAGISLGGSALDKEALATIRSRAFTMRFIEDNKLLPVLFESRWDAERKAWKPSWFRDDPRLSDAYEKFDQKVRDVSQDRRTGLVTLTIRWTDRVLAAQWANDIVNRVNTEMRTRAISESRRNIEYLEKQLAAAQVATVRDSISRVIENEVRRAMLAEVRQDYAFRVIDPAGKLDEDEFVAPNRKLLLAGSLAAGLAFGLLAAVALHLRGRGRRRDA